MQPFFANPGGRLTCGTALRFQQVVAEGLVQSQRGEHGAMGVQFRQLADCFHDRPGADAQPVVDCTPEHAADGGSAAAELGKARRARRNDELPLRLPRGFAELCR